MSVDIEKRNKRQNAWIKENADRINIMFVKGTKDNIKTLAEKKGLSISEYVRDAVSKQIAEDEDGENIPDKVISNSIEWLKKHDHSSADIIDFLKYIGKETE